MPDPTAKPSVPTDIEIAQAAQLRPIRELARDRLGIDDQFLEPYGRYKAKVALRFIKALPARLSDARLAELDRAFGLSRSGNAEVLFVWLRLGIRNRYAPVLPAVERFLLGMGRRKFAQPLYRALVEQGAWGRPVAERIYARARPGYHAVTAGPIDRILRGQPAG